MEILLIAFLALLAGMKGGYKIAKDAKEEEKQTLLDNDANYVFAHYRVLRDMVDFDLKIESKYFKQVRKGTKTCEVRKEDDKHFRSGDIIRLHELDDNREYTNNTLNIRVTDVLRDSEYCKSGYAVLSFRLLSAYELRRRWLVDVPEEVRNRIQL